MRNTTASEDRIIRDAENSTREVREILERMDQELTDANGLIKRLELRIAELEADLNEAKQ